MDVRRILWPTDFSQNAAQALPYVTSLTEKYQAEIHLLYVIEKVDYLFPEFDRLVIDKMYDQKQEIAEKQLDRICNIDLKCPHHMKHIATGHPAEEILKLVEKEKLDMVVMAKRGRAGHFRFGSVSEKVVKHSSVPIVIIPIDSEE